MTRKQIEHMNRYTDKHVRDPQPGDHFTEQLGSVAYIDSRDGDNLMVRKISTCGPDKGWTVPSRMTVAEFIKWASYGSIPGYWLEIWPPSFPKELLEGG